MASGNVELVRSIYARWESGDFSSVEWAHPEIEFVSLDGPSAGRWTGHAGLEQGWRPWLSAWEAFSAQADEYQELDEERVLVLVSFGGRGKTSGVDLLGTWTKGASVFHVRAGQVTRLLIYTDYEHALTDLGIASPDGPAGS